jgi:hypothetical protein
MLPDAGPGGGLFLSPIPVPQGDPAELSHAAGTYTAAQGEISRNHAALTGAASQAGGLQWSGTGAAGYLAATTDLAAAYAATSAALAKGASALRAYSASLATAKATAHQANAAVATSNAAASAFLAAQATAEQSQAAATDAAQASASADAQATANPHSPQAKATAENARTTASDAQSSATSAWNRVSTLSAQYEADHARAVSLCARAQQEAKQAAARAAAGFDAAANGLMGKSARPVPGGAKGDPGGGVWDTVIDEIFLWNNKPYIQTALNGWGAFGAVVLGRSELGFLESKAATGVALSTWGSTFDDIQAGNKGWLSSNIYKEWEAVIGATREQQSAWSKFLDAFRPKPGDYGFGANFARAGLGVGMLSDALTEWRPGPSYGPGGMFGGNAFRVAAGVNFAASGIALGSSLGYAWAGAALAIIPGGQLIVGGVIVATSLYFAGAFVYQHWNDVVSWSKDAWHGIEDANNWANNELNKLGSGIVNEGGKLASGFGHDVGKVISWL